MKLSLEDSAFQRGLQNSRDKLDSWGSSLRSIGTKMTAGVTVPLVGAGLAAINWASDLEQAIGKSEAVFGDQSSAVQEWSKSTAKAYGFSRSESLAMASTYGALFKVMGMGNDIASEYSMELIGLSADMAAFNDVSNSRASEALMAGLSGEYMSLRSMGVFLNEAAVSQEALTIAQAAGREEITEADKVQARYNLIMEQTTQQHGQAAREAGGWASRLAQVRARVKDVGASIGQRLTPFALKLLDTIERLADWVGNLSPRMQTLALIIAAVAAAAGPLLIALGLMLPGLSALLGVVGFLLSPIGLLIAAVGLLAYAFRDEIGTAIVAVIDWFRDFVTSSEDVQDMVANLRDAFQAFKNGDYAGAFDAIWGAIQNVGAAFASLAGAVGTWVLTVGVPMLAGWVVDIAGNVWEGIKSLAGWAWDNKANLGDVFVSIGSWINDGIQNVWDWLNGLYVGSALAGDGTGGPMDKTGQVSLGDVLVNIGKWLEGALPDLAADVLSWVKDTSIEVQKVSVDIANWAVENWPSIDEAIENALGAVIPYTVKKIRLGIAEIDVDAGNVAKVLESKVLLAAGAMGVIALGALAVSVPLAPVMAVGALALLGGFIIKETYDYFQKNPLKLYDVMIDVAFLLDDVIVGVQDLETELDKLGVDLPLEGTFRNILTTVEVISDHFKLWEAVLTGDWSTAGDILSKDYSNDDSKPNSSGNTPIGTTIEYDSEGRPLNPESGAPMTIEEWNEFNKPPASGGFLAVGDSIFRQIGAGAAFAREQVVSAGASLGSLVAQSPALQMFGSSATASFTSAGTSAQTNLTPIGGLAASMAAGLTGAAIPAFAGVNAAAALNFGAMLSAVSSNTSSAATTAGANSMSMASSVVANALTMASGAKTNASDMNRSVSAEALGMQVATVAKAVLMQAGFALNMAKMLSTAQTTGTSITTAMQTGMQGATAAISAHASNWPAILSGYGGRLYSTGISVGQQAAAGVAQGMLNGLATVQAAPAAIITAVDEAMRAKARISSPSKMTMRLGEYIGEGFEQGIRSMIPDVARATTDMVNVPATPQLGGPGFSLASSASSGSKDGGNQYVTIVTLEPGKWREFLEEAERGSSHALAWQHPAEASAYFRKGRR